MLLFMAIKLYLYPRICGISDETDQKNKNITTFPHSSVLCSHKKNKKIIKEEYRTAWFVSLTIIKLFSFLTKNLQNMKRMYQDKSTNTMHTGQ